MDTGISDRMLTFVSILNMFIFRVFLYLQKASVDLRMLFTVTEEITFDEAPVMQHPTQFTDALIKCQVSGQPLPSVTWRYRGSRIITGLCSFLLKILTAIVRER